LLDADLAINARGGAAAWLLALVLAGAATLLWQLTRLPVWRRHWVSGKRGATGQRKRILAQSGRLGFSIFIGAYLAVMLVLATGSVSGIWPFPQVLPQTFTAQAWGSVWTSFSTVQTTMTLAFCSAFVALLWSVAWLECAPQQWDLYLRRVIYLPLVLPPVLWVLGVHGVTLKWGVDARWVGLWLAHTLAAVPYVLIALSPAYTGFDPRLRQISASLGHSRLVFLWRVKWPLLRAAVASAFAIGFAVSVAQYLPTLFIGAGRFATVTTEAVTLAAGAQRSLTAAYAWLQWILPVLVFGVAAWLGKPRRF
jgi:putative thiamine transport system permease protein